MKNWILTEEKIPFLKGYNGRLIDATPDREAEVLELGPRSGRLKIRISTEEKIPFLKESISGITAASLM